MTRTIAVLGAGTDQRAIIRAARREHHVIAFDGREDAEARGEADEFHCASNRDVAGMAVRLASVSGLAGVITAGAECAVEVALLSKALLGYGNLAAAILCRDKLEQKYQLAVAGVPATKTHQLRGVPSYADYVVKPRYGYGSRGVTLNWPRHAAFAEASSVPAPYGYTQEALVEMYEPGVQVSAEAIVWDGRCKLVAFVERVYEIKHGRFRELGGFSPSSIENLAPAAERLMGDAAKVLGIVRGTIKGDLVLTGEGLKIIECHPRLSGGPLSEIVRRRSGVEYFPEAVRIACGMEPRWDRLEPTGQEHVYMNMDWTTNTQGAPA